jgi:L-lactate dehydrogenase complex protein LldG
VDVDARPEAGREGELPGLVAGAMSSREAILGRVRAAIAGAQPETVPRSYRRVGRRSAAETADLFCERVGEYRAEVVRVPAGDVARTVGEALARRGAQRIVVPPGLAAESRPEGVSVVEDTGLTPRELDGVDGVVTGCTLGIAETGTIVLTSDSQEGRRALTLVPDLHVCVIDESQIVELVPEAIEALASRDGAARRPVTFVSGPSATSDIELSRVEGVHGPRDLVVVVVRRPSPPSAP